MHTPFDRLEAASGENGEVEAKTTFLVYRLHLDTDHQPLSGCREDMMRKENGAWIGHPTCSSASMRCIE